MLISIGQFVSEMPFLFIASIFAFATFILLKSVKMLFVQLLLFLTLSTVVISTFLPAQIALGIVQIIFLAFGLYKFFKAIHYNYQLVLEKTHQVPPGIARNSYNGVKKTFL